MKQGKMEILSLRVKLIMAPSDLKNVNKTQKLEIPATHLIIFSETGAEASGCILAASEAPALPTVLISRSR
jgi:hypothetical protein